MTKQKRVTEMTAFELLNFYNETRDQFARKVKLIVARAKEFEADDGNDSIIESVLAEIEAERQARIAEFNREFLMASSHQAVVEQAQADHYARLRTQALTFFAENEAAWAAYLGAISPSLMRGLTSATVGGGFASAEPVRRLLRTPAPALATRLGGGVARTATPVPGPVYNVSPTIYADRLTVDQVEGVVFRSLNRVFAAQEGRR